MGIVRQTGDDKIPVLCAHELHKFIGLGPLITDVAPGPDHVRRGNDIQYPGSYPGFIQRTVTAPIGHAACFRRLQIPVRLVKKSIQGGCKKDVRKTYKHLVTTTGLDGEVIGGDSREYTIDNLHAICLVLFCPGKVDSFAQESADKFSDPG